jgi:hypothetical protein
VYASIGVRGSDFKQNPWRRVQGSSRLLEWRKVARQGSQALRKNKVPGVEIALSKPVSWRYFTKKLHDKDGQGAIACLPEEVNLLQ